MPLPARLRLTLLMILFVYPIVTGYLYLLGPFTTGWTIWQRCLILVPMMVVTIVFIITPAITRLFGGFIAKGFGRVASTRG